jgi:hypothetical protein
MLLEKNIEKRKSLLYYLMFVGIMFLLPEHVEANEFIVKDGKAGAEIIIGENPTRMQKLAAEELQHYIKKLSGAEVPVLNETGDAKIKIYIGKSKYTDKMGLKNSDLDSGAYRMVTGENFLVLMGNDTNFFMDKPGDGGPEYPAKRGDRIRCGAHPLCPTSKVTTKSLVSGWAIGMGHSMRSMTFCAHLECGGICRVILVNTSPI